MPLTLGIILHIYKIYTDECQIKHFLSFLLRKSRNLYYMSEITLAMGLAIVLCYSRQLSITLNFSYSPVFDSLAEFCNIKEIYNFYIFLKEEFEAI